MKKLDITDRNKKASSKLNIGKFVKERSETVWNDERKRAHSERTKPVWAHKRQTFYDTSVVMPILRSPIGPVRQ